MAVKFTEFFKGIRLKHVDQDPSDNVDGSMWYNSTEDKIKMYIGGSLQSITSSSDITGLSPLNTVYVSKNGNNSTADGSAAKPYLTVKAALASITNASLSNRYLLILSVGTFLEDNDLVLNEYVSMKGMGRGQTFIGRTDGSVIPMSVSAGYTSGSTNRPHFSIQDITFKNAVRVVRPSTGILTTEEYVLGVYRSDFGTSANVVRAGTIAIGSNLITALSTTADLFDGMTVTGSGIPANTTISVKNQPAGTVKMSANATANNSTNKTFAHPSFAFHGVGTATFSNFGNDILDMEGCFLGGPLMVRGAGIGIHGKISNSKINGNIIVRDDGTMPQDFATVTAVDTGLGTVTVAPGKLFYPSNGVDIAHVYTYPGGFARTAHAVSGGTTLTALNSTVGIADGMTVTGTGIPANTTVTITGQPANTVLLSNVLTASSTFGSFVFSVPLRQFSYTAFDSGTGVFSGAVPLFAGALPSVGEKITTYLGTTIRLESVHHVRVIARSEASDFGASTVQVELLGGSFNGQNLILDGINARTSADAAGLAVVTDTTFSNSAPTLNEFLKTFSSRITHNVPTTGKPNWPLLPVKASEAIDFLAEDKFWKVLGTRAAPILLTAGTAVTLSDRQAQQKIYVAGSGGPVTVTANPAIPVGTKDGQMLALVGRDATNTVTYNTGGGLSLKSSSVVLGLDDSIILSWDGTNWVENNRTGVVIGPALSTTNALVRFVDTTGQVVKNSGVVLSDTDHLEIPGKLSVDNTTTDDRKVSIKGNSAHTAAFLAIDDEADTNLFSIFGNGRAELSGDLLLITPGKGLRIKEGADATMGVATLIAGTVTVPTTVVTTNSRIMLTSQNASGVPGAVYISARIDGTSFDITSTSVADTSDVAWVIINPAT